MYIYFYVYICSPNLTLSFWSKLLKTNRIGRKHFTRHVQQLLADYQNLMNKERMENIVPSLCVLVF